MDDSPTIARVQLCAEALRKEWTSAAYQATYLNKELPADARFEAYKAASYGGLW
jgi:hypothetical protein